MNQGVLTWSVVLLVGVLVVGLVLGLGLFPRLAAGQRVLDGAGPAFTEERVAGARAGIEIVSSAVDTVDPIMTPEGGAAAEVGPLVEFVATQANLTPDQVLAALQGSFPHTYALLNAIPLSEVSAEIPQLVTFLSTTLGISEEEVLQAVQANFPNLAQAITALPTATEGWNDVPGSGGLTRFDGSSVTTVPQVRDYFSEDVIPVLEEQQQNTVALAGTGGVSFLAMLLLVAGLVVIVFGILMMVLSTAGPLPRPLATAAWSTVIAVGALVVVLVFALQLSPRLSGGQALIGSVGPAFTEERVAGARAGIEIVSTVADAAAPIVTPEGGAAAEVPQLLAFVSAQTGLTQDQVVAALQANFPHTLALLQAIPLSDVSTEIPLLVDFLAGTLGISQEEVLAAVETNFPNLYQAITNLPDVTAGWNSVPDIEGLTRFDGQPVESVVDVRDYFREDVIPVLEEQQGNYQALATPFPPVNVFAPLLLVVGIIVIIYGALMLLLVQRGGAGAAPAPQPA